MPISVPKVPYQIPGDEEATWVDLYNVMYLERTLFLGQEIRCESTPPYLASRGRDPPFQCHSKKKWESKSTFRDIDEVSLSKESCRFVEEDQSLLMLCFLDLSTGFH